MTQKTPQLFQLFLSIFAIYAVINGFPDECLIVPLFCLVCMFFVGKHDPAFVQSTNGQSGQNELLANAWASKEGEVDNFKTSSHNPCVVLHCWSVFHRPHNEHQAASEQKTCLLQAPMYCAEGRQSWLPSRNRNAGACRSSPEISEIAAWEALAQSVVRNSVGTDQLWLLG